MLFNAELEANFLSAAIKTPLVLADCSRLTESDFGPTNRMVFSALKACAASGGDYSPFVLIDRLNSLNVKVADEIAPAAYINSLLMRGVNSEAAEGLAKELKRISIRREINKIGREIQELTARDIKEGDKEPMKAAELLAAATKIFNDQVNLIGGTEDSEPVDLYGTIRQFLDRDNSVSSKAIALPYPIMTDLYGYMDVGSCYLYCSRMKIGKSSWWLSMGQQLAAQDVDDTLRILVLDTELEAWENHSRSLAAVSGVSEFRIRQGWYRKRKEELEKVEAAADLLEPLEGRVDHCFCGGKSLEELASICRRWAAKNLTEGKRGLIVYDYIKLGGADFKSRQPLFVQTGEKMEVFKNLSKELQVPVMCFAQTNRENVDSKGGDKQQNSSVIGGSDMLAQFAANVYLLEELTPEERAALNQLGKDDATHSLREIACRQRGACELGEDRLVEIQGAKGQKSRFIKNYLLFRFKTFAVTEIATIREVIARNAAMGIKVQEMPAGSAPLL